jgi:AraC-like DNA-binding protein
MRNLIVTNIMSLDGYYDRVTPEELANLAHLRRARDLMTRRIERAKALLRRGDMSVTEMCMAVGCTSLGSFSSRFTERVGETPARTAPGTTAPARPCPRAS